MELTSLLLESLQFPGAVIIGYNKAMPDIENDVDFYEVGVQQAVGKTPKRFANICSRDNEVVMIYFKHDPEIILDLYQQYSNILPSEIASAHWSKIDFPNELSIESINALIDKSYQLICASIPKKRHTELVQIATEANQYLLFKEKAEALMATHSTLEFHYNHMAFWAPTLTIDDKPMAYFHNNSVFVKTDNFVKPNAVDSHWEKKIS